jgi:hypothetical protein
LLVGLLLSGLHFPILRLYEGYPLQHGRRIAGVRWIYAGMVGRWGKCFDALEAKRAVPQASADRSAAARRLAREFPATRDQLLPTRFGNAVRSFERHPRVRYGLDGVTAWPRVKSHEVV